MTIPTFVTSLFFYNFFREYLNRTQINEDSTQNTHPTQTKHTAPLPTQRKQHRTHSSNFILNPQYREFWSHPPKPTDPPNIHAKTLRTIVKNTLIIDHFEKYSIRVFYKMGLPTLKYYFTLIEYFSKWSIIKVFLTTYQTPLSPPPNGPHVFRSAPHKVIFPAPKHHDP